MTDDEFPTLRQTVLDTSQPRVLAEFYRQLLGYRYAPGSEPSGDEAQEQGIDWLTLLDSRGARILAFQLVVGLPRPVWPDGDPPQMMHLDTQVPTFEALQRQRDRAVALGATIISDQSGDPDEALYVFADPSGHPFCIFVADD